MAPSIGYTALPPSPQKPLKSSVVEGPVPVPNGKEGLEELTAKQRLLNPPTPPRLSVGKAIASGWRLFTDNAAAYVLWSFVMIAISCIVNMVANSVEMPGLAWPAQLLYFPLAVGPFVTAANCLRAEGTGLKYQDLFLTGFKFYGPIFLIHLIQSLIYSIVIAGGLVVAVTFYYIAPATAAIVAIPFIPLVAYLMLTLSFAVYIYMEFHPADVGIIDSIRISWRSSHAIIFDLALLALASVGIYFLGMLCLMVGVLVAMPVILLAWVCAFDQVFGVNNSFSGRPDSCVCCC